MNVLKKAVLIGYHGKGNFGDDIFRRVILGYLQEDLAVSECALFLAGEDELCEYAQSPRIVGFRNWLPSIPRLRWLQVFLHATNADLLVFGGGSLFRQKSFGEPALMLWLLRRINPKLRVVALGVSVGPLPAGAKKSCARFLAYFDVLLLRDSHSVDILATLGIGGDRYLEGFDLALLSHFDSPPVSARTDEAGKTLGISLTQRAISPKEIGLLAAVVGRALQEYAGLTIQILVACSDERDGDQALSQTLSVLLSEHADRVSTAVHRDRDLARFTQAIAESAGLVACRMHVGIAGLMYGKPTLQVAYEPKVTGFYQKLQLEQRDLVPSAGELIAKLPEFIDRLFANSVQTHYKRNSRSLAEYGVVQKQLMTKTTSLINGESV